MVWDALTRAPVQQQAGKKFSLPATLTPYPKALSNCSPFLCFPLRESLVFGDYIFSPPDKGHNKLECSQMLESGSTAAGKALCLLIGIGPVLSYVYM